VSKRLEPAPFQHLHAWAARSVPKRREFGAVSVLVCVDGTDLCHNGARTVSEWYKVPSTATKVPVERHDGHFSF
jgi:hypothetical protein